MRKIQVTTSKKQVNKGPKWLFKGFKGHSSKIQVLKVFKGHASTPAFTVLKIKIPIPTKFLRSDNGKVLLVNNLALYDNALIRT